MKLPPGHDVARQCHQIASAKNTHTLRWGDIGPKLLTQVVRDAGLQAFARETRVFCPIPSWQWDVALSGESDWSRFVSEQTYAIHLWHEMWRRSGKDRLADFPPASLVAHLARRYET